MRIDSVTPAAARSGDVVTLAGAGFVDESPSGVTVAGVSAAYDVTSDTAMTVTIPPGTPAAGATIAIQAMRPYGTNAAQLFSPCGGPTNIDITAQVTAGTGALNAMADLVVGGNNSGLWVNSGGVTPSFITLQFDVSGMASGGGEGPTLLARYGAYQVYIPAFNTYSNPPFPLSYGGCSFWNPTTHKLATLGQVASLADEWLAGCTYNGHYSDASQEIYFRVDYVPFAGAASGKWTNLYYGEATLLPGYKLMGVWVNEAPPQYDAATSSVIIYTATHPRFRINPKQGPTRGGTACILTAIEGSTFYDPMVVIFDSTGTPISVSATVIDDTTAECDSPAHAAGTTDVDATCG